MRECIDGVENFFFFNRLGVIEIPIEFTSNISELFYVCHRNSCYNKSERGSVLSPLFLFLVCALLIRSVMLKMVRTRFQNLLRPYFIMSVKTPVV